MSGEAWEVFVVETGSLGGGDLCCGGVVAEEGDRVLAYAGAEERLPLWLRVVLAGLCVGAGLVAIGWLWLPWGPMIACFAEPPFQEVRIGGLGSVDIRWNLDEPAVLTSVRVAWVWLGVSVVATVVSALGGWWGARWVMRK